MIKVMLVIICVLSAFLVFDIASDSDFELDTIGVDRVIGVEVFDEVDLPISSTVKHNVNTIQEPVESPTPNVDHENVVVGQSLTYPNVSVVYHPEWISPRFDIQKLYQYLAFVGLPQTYRLVFRVGYAHSDCNTACVYIEDNQSTVYFPNESKFKNGITLSHGVLHETIHVVEAITGNDSGEWLASNVSKIAFGVLAGAPDIEYHLSSVWEKCVIDDPVHCQGEHVSVNSATFIETVQFLQRVGFVTQ